MYRNLRTHYQLTLTNNLFPDYVIILGMGPMYILLGVALIDFLGTCLLHFPNLVLLPKTFPGICQRESEIQNTHLTWTDYHSFNHKSTRVIHLQIAKEVNLSN